jgi:hypothetical protein
MTGIGTPNNHNKMPLPWRPSLIRFGHGGSSCGSLSSMGALGGAESAEIHLPRATSATAHYNYSVTAPLKARVASGAGVDAYSGFHKRL